MGANGSQNGGSVIRCGPAQGSCTPAPIDLGSSTDEVILILYGTGVRGAPSLADVLCSMGGVPADVLFAAAQGSAGLDQINLLIPDSLRGRGLVDVTVSVDGQLANTVTVAIR